MIITQTYLPNITSTYAKNELLRLIWKKSNVRDFDSEKYIRESRDEVNAKGRLELINLNKQVPWPAIWEDPDVFLDIYNQAMDTKSKSDIILKYEQYAQTLAQQWQWMWAPWEGNGQILNSAMNNENSKSQSVISANPWL
jgi:hypothetical protein